MFNDASTGKSISLKYPTLTRKIVHAEAIGYELGQAFASNLLDRNGQLVGRASIQHLCTGPLALSNRIRHRNPIS
jgi:hypothetical protein